MADLPPNNHVREPSKVIGTYQVVVTIRAVLAGVDEGTAVGLVSGGISFGMGLAQAVQEVGITSGPGSTSGLVVPRPH